MVPPPWSSTNALPITSKDAGPTVSGGFPVRSRTMNHGSRSSSAAVGNVSQSRHTMVTPAERNTRSVSAFALATIGSPTPFRLHTATFICWPAASSSTEHRAVISSVLICASPPKPHPKGVRFALIRAILLRQTPSGAKKMGSPRSEEHTSELQSLTNLACRLLLETKRRLRLRVGTDRGRRGAYLRHRLGRGCGRPARPAGGGPVSPRFFLNNTGPPEIYPLSLHGALPI